MAIAGIDAVGAGPAEQHVAHAAADDIQRTLMRLGDPPSFADECQPRRIEPILQCLGGIGVAVGIAGAAVLEGAQHVGPGDDATQDAGSIDHQDASAVVDASAARTRRISVSVASPVMVGGPCQR